MGRPHRTDVPGSIHHVTNRGIAKRTVFERQDEIRRFLALVAREVHRGTLEVIAFAVLTTHFHLLVRSPQGKLSEAMQRIENGHVKAFNRGRRRDGPLVRGRFFSRVVDSVAYLLLLIRYIDANPVRAGLAGRAGDYPWCSAFWYTRPRRPRWLDGTWVEKTVRDATGAATLDSGSYERVFGGGANEAESRLLQARMAMQSSTDDLDDLIDAARPDVRAWMERKALLADGTRPGLPVVDQETVIEVLEAEGRREVRYLRRRPIERDAWPIMASGLLRDLAATTWKEIGFRIRTSLVSARNYHEIHRESLRTEPGYSEAIAALAHECLRRCHRPVPAAARVQTRA